jgi:uncharacterized protein
MNPKKAFVWSAIPGPAWVVGKTSREQPYWTEHAAFMDQLFEDGMVVMAGPYADYSGVLLILEAESEQAVEATFKDDPFIIHGVLRISSIREWLIFLDARRK